MTVGCDIDVLKDPRLTDGCGLACHWIDERELRRGVILEQVLVVRRLQHVFERSDWTRPARALLRVWFGWHEWLRGRWTMRGGHELDQERAVVGHPRERIAEH